MKKINAKYVQDTESRINSIVSSLIEEIRRVGPGQAAQILTASGIPTKKQNLYNFITGRMARSTEWVLKIAKVLLGTKKNT